MANERLDILAANQLGRALFSELYAAPARPVNTARFVFLDPRAEASYGDWDRVATETVAILGSAAGRDPYNRYLSDLVGELATQAEAFRTRWELEVELCVESRLPGTSRGSAGQGLTVMVPVIWAGW